MKGGTTTGARAKVTVVGLKYCFPPSYDAKLRYVGVEVSVESLARENLVVSDGAAVLIDEAGQRFPYQRFSGEGLYTPRNECYPDLQAFMRDATVLHPGEKQRGWIHDFPVPPKAHGFKVRFQVFTDKEWHAAANLAQPEEIEVVVGDQGVP